MARPVYVIGHKNSDLDSVASAYAYAKLLQMQGEEEAIAARNGELKPEVRFVLERFQVEAPEAIEDVYLQVRDVMRRGVTCAYLDQPLFEAGQLLQEHDRRSMPVVDEDNKVYGIIATEDLAKLFFNDLFVRLRKFGLCLNAQASCVVKQLVNALVRNFPVKQFAHTWLRLSEDHLQFLL